MNADAVTAAFPRAPDEITTGWLTEALRSGRVLSSGGVASFRSEQIGVGKGFAGRLARLSLDYEAGPDVAPRTIIAKFPAGEGPTRALAERFGFYAREVHFYQQIGERTGIPVPRCYFSAIAPDGDVVLLLEDVSNARGGDLVRGCSLDEAACVVEALAEMHARWWNSPELASFAWVPAPDDEAALQLGREISRPAWEAFLKKAGKHIPRKLIALGDKNNGDPAMLHRLSAAPRTLVHGDVAANNLLFGPDGIAALIDWQTVIQGRGPIDVAHFLVTSLLTEDRRAAEAELLPRYHRLLIERGVRDYSFKECWDDYRMAVMNEFGQIVALSYLIDIGGQITEEVDAATGTRPLAALIELDVADLVPMPTLWDRIRSFGRRPA